MVHNARFDMGVIHVCYEYYGMELPVFHYFDSLSVNAGEKFPDFAGLKFPLSDKKIY